MKGSNGRVGDAAPEFLLDDQNGAKVNLKDILKVGPVLIVFYPGDFTTVCTKQLCNYRDNFESFRNLGIQVVGISPNTFEENLLFAKRYDFPFILLSDRKKETAKNFGCTSLLLFGGISRAVFIVSSKGRILYRYVEPTALTRRKADELIFILQELKAKGQLQ